MNTDFRVTVDAFDHPKLVKLERLCGPHGVLCLLRLWGFTSRYHPKGNLNAMTVEDVEIAAKWNGDPGIFSQALLDLRLIDDRDGVLWIHDWDEHNRYAYYAPERSEKASHAASIRWASPEHASSNAKGNAGSNAPSPSPTPTPNPKPTPNPDPKEYSPELREFVDELFPESEYAGWSESQRLKQVDALDKLIRIDGFSKNEVFAVLRWMRQDDFWSGVFQSIPRLRVDGQKKYRNARGQWQKGSRDLPFNKRLDDDSKFKETRIVDL